MIKKINIFILTFLFLIQFIHAFSLENFGNKKSGLNSGLNIKMYPQYPSSNQKVDIELSSFTFNLDQSETAVYINNKLYKKEYGLKEFNFVTQESGKNNLIQAISKDINGRIYEKSIEFTSQNVSLVYEIINPYKPFNYKGKSTILSNSELNVYAFTDFKTESGQKIDKKSLIYTWYVNKEIDQKASGLGKYKYYINRLVAYPTDMYISVIVTDINKKKIGQKEIYFEPEQTKTDFYIVDKSLPFNFKNTSDKKIKTNKNQFTLKAVPYFINRNQDTEITFSINNISQNLDNNLEIPILNDAANNTILKVFFQVKNSYRILQTASKKIDLILDKNTGQFSDSKYFNEGRNSGNNSGLFGI